MQNMEVACSLTVTSRLDFIPFESVLWGSQAEKPPSPFPVSVPHHSSVCMLFTFWAHRSCIQRFFGSKLALISYFSSFRNILAALDSVLFHINCFLFLHSVKVPLGSWWTQTDLIMKCGRSLNVLNVSLSVHNRGVYPHSLISLCDL